MRSIRNRTLAGALALTVVSDGVGPAPQTRRRYTMTRFANFAAALSMLVLSATAAFAQDGAHDGEGAFRPATYALGFSGAPVQAASTRALPTYNEGQGGDTQLARPAASVSGPAGRPIPGYAFNTGANGNG